MTFVTATGATRTLFIACSTALAAALVAGACGPAEPKLEGPIDADTYAVVMAELADLERFPPPGSDEVTRTERADSVRRDILERHGVSAGELLEFAKAAGAHPDRMVEIVDRIVEITDSLARNRTGSGRAVDSAAAAAAAAAAPYSDSVPEGAIISDSPADARADSPAGVLDTLPLRQRLREMRERGGRERSPSP